jgi:hypothetical protein
MKIREYRPEDLDALKKMHAAQGLDYPFPADLSDPIFLVRLVLEEKPNVPLMAMLLRLTCEAYLLAYPKLDTPFERMRRFLALHRAMEKAAFDRGLQDVSAFLPPQVAKPFGRRLERLGWVKDPWTCYVKRLEAY